LLFLGVLAKKWAVIKNGNGSPYAERNILRLVGDLKRKGSNAEGSVQKKGANVGQFSEMS